MLLPGDVIVWHSVNSLPIPQGSLLIQSLEHQGFIYFIQFFSISGGSVNYSFNSIFTRSADLKHLVRAGITVGLELCLHSCICAS